MPKDPTKTAPATPLVWRESDAFELSMKGVGKRRGHSALTGAPRYSRAQLTKIKARGGGRAR